MRPHKVLMTTPFLFFITIIWSSFCVTPSLTGDPLFFNCSISGDNYTSSSSYGANLRRLLSNLLTSEPKSLDLFFNSTAGSAVYGLAQCRLDVNHNACSSCLALAADTAFNGTCANQKSASIRYDDCVLRYADQPIVSFLSEPGFVNLDGANDRTSYVPQFNRQLEELMNLLAREAANSPHRIAAEIKNVNFDMVGGGYKTVNISGYAWCTKDLARDDCFQCLKNVINKSCCADKLGGGAATASCIVSYSDSPFFNVSRIQTLAPPPPPPPPRPPSPGFPSGHRRGIHAKKIIVAATVSASAMFSTLAIFLIFRRATQKASRTVVENDAKVFESNFRFAWIKAATNNFSNESMLGEGRFGSVYKGVLMDGQQIVVKRLSETSVPGLLDLRNEAALVAQLQHKNLVKLLGCCMQENEMLLVYEYLPNASLERHLCDPALQARLDWKSRYAIIEGVARGLDYLHNHSRIRIIHRDLNASNILLDSDMNPKISNFGMAKLVTINENQWSTKQVSGAFGYMAPEYTARGLFSTKSDVFSFGMVVLEIITGRRNGGFIQLGNTLNLQTYVWQHWNNESAEEVIDKSLGGQYELESVLRCINIGLLCIQTEPQERPNIASVVLMLSSTSEALPFPSLPAYFSLENPTSMLAESSGYYLIGANDDLHLREQVAAGNGYVRNVSM